MILGIMLARTKNTLKMTLVHCVNAVHTKHDENTRDQCSGNPGILRRVVI